MIQLLPLSLASSHTNLSLFSLLEPDVPCLFLQQTRLILTSGPLHEQSFLPEGSFPRSPHVCFLSPFKSSPLRCSS